ncbi:MAG: DUF2076 family protein [Betaproteobacteria bacterium]|nr:DUF2076 family protein [Betaproteobacteria bacterium]
MKPQEREQLNQFLQQMNQAQLAGKDEEADAMIRGACARQPDASYLLVQRAILQDQALHEAGQQIARLQAELEQLRAAGGGNRESSFLNDNAWGASAAMRPGARVPPAARFAQAAPVPTTAAPGTSGVWGGGMLGSIATTAAGVVAGSFLFQGIGHLMGNHATGAGGMNGLTGNIPDERSDTSAFDKHADDFSANAGVMDTSSLDDLVSDDTADYV